MYTGWPVVAHVELPSTFLVRRRFHRCGMSCGVLLDLQTLENQLAWTQKQLRTLHPSDGSVKADALDERWRVDAEVDKRNATAMQTRLQTLTDVLHHILALRDALPSEALSLSPSTTAASPATGAGAAAGTSTSLTVAAGIVQQVRTDIWCLKKCTCRTRGCSCRTCLKKDLLCRAL